MPDVLEGLNESQKEAVLTVDRHVLAVAGPGTGKTLTIVRRICHLIRGGVPPTDIIAVTFTNRAAREMRERICGFMGSEGSGLFIGTFHLLGLRIMRDSGLEPVICSGEEQIRMVGSAARCSGQAARRAAGKISRVKGLVEAPDNDTARVLDVYREMLREKGMYDFDDLITTPLDLLESGKAAYGLAHIIVDEYQDISPGQYRLLRRIAGERTRVCAVGDSDQAIYAFRGADIRNFLNFRRDYRDAAMVVLQENYRSTGLIVHAAAGLIRNNRQRIEKEVRPTGENGKAVGIVSVPDERAEGEFIVRAIEARMGPTSHFRLDRQTAPGDYSGNTRSFSDFAVLFRTNGQAKALQEAFLEWGIPCQVVGEKMPSRHGALIEKLRAYAETPPDGLDLGRIMADIGAGEASLSAAERAILANLTAAYGGLPIQAALCHAIDELSVLGTADAFDPRSEAVALMTLHMAKGLEFKVVFVAGVEEGLIPFVFGKDESDIEEERRLFYVGMTRAKEELFLVYARKRLLYGHHSSGSPSPFLSEIPGMLIRPESVPDRAAKKGGRQMGLFGQ